MNLNLLLFLFLFPLVCFGVDEISHLEALEVQASKYRKMSIECVTDVSLTKKEIVEVDTCKLLYKFTISEYPILKENLVKAEEKAKLDAETSGFEDTRLRERLILIASAKSHMSVAGSILNKVR